VKDLFVYVLTNERRTTLYIGVTNNLEGRIWQHQNGEGSKFAKRYNLSVLIYFEAFPEARAAIARETQLKGWTRAKMEALIATMNPEWRDLSEEIFGAESPVVRRDCATHLRPGAVCDSSTALHSAQNARGVGGGRGVGGARKC